VLPVSTATGGAQGGASRRRLANRRRLADLGSLQAYTAAPAPAEQGGTTQSFPQPLVCVIPGEGAVTAAQPRPPDGEAANTG
jgi:hypothetical protein